ncbi:MAG: 4Fe-4S binding protein [Anaerolineae bacterium]|nr:4Fe-4S binding protein [Anaerolineae bacterium]
MIMVNRDRCGVCGCCVPVCPPDAITLHDAYLEVNNDTCTECMKCIPVCPTNALFEVLADSLVTVGGT